MMHDKNLVIYKSVTGFTKQYAEMIAQELDCPALELKNVSAKTLSEYETVIFGGRFHAGSIDGLKKARKLFEAGTAKQLVVFATGATPNTAQDIITDAWNSNFTPDELKNTPHFYMQAGLRYERMPFFDKIMMKAFVAMMKHKKDKNAYEKSLESAISASYDISAREYIRPLLACLKREQ